MSIKDEATAALARVPEDNHNNHFTDPETGAANHIAVYLPVNRLEWLDVLKAAKPTGPEESQLVAELLLGSESSPGVEVGVLAVQALAVCNMVPAPTE